MTMNRRRMLGLSAGAAVLATSPRLSAATADATGDIRDSALTYFGGQGFALLPPLGLITDSAFNGGLRYDESRSDAPSGPWITVQPSTRVEDVAVRDRPGVLALFNIIGLRDEGGDEAGTLFGRVMDFLVEERGLDPERMVFVSTDLFSPYRDRFDAARRGRFLERSQEEAHAAGDGSGFFAPNGHPDGPSMATVGVYYPILGTTPAGDLRYPPVDHIEIADIGIEVTSESGRPVEGAGIGLERLAMAEGETVPDFEEMRLNLLRIIEDEAERTGKPLPPGYTTFASL